MIGPAQSKPNRRTGLAQPHHDFDFSGIGNASFQLTSNYGITNPPTYLPNINNMALCNDGAPLCNNYVSLCNDNYNADIYLPNYDFIYTYDNVTPYQCPVKKQVAAERYGNVHQLEWLRLETISLNCVLGRKLFIRSCWNNISVMNEPCLMMGLYIINYRLESCT